MTQTERDMQLVESQPLTVKNAHRVAMIRKKESTEPPVPFHFRKKHLGMESFVHFSGKPEDEKELRPTDFKDWEVTEFKYPGYLEDLWEATCNAYRWSSFDPDIRGESDIMIYEKEIHDDLKRIPAERHEDVYTEIDSVYFECVVADDSYHRYVGMHHQSGYIFKDGACSLDCSLCECGLFQKIQICVV